MSARDRQRRDRVKCEDMRVHAERAIRFMGERSLEEFLSDELIQAAIIRCVEVIGEAARSVSPESQSIAPDIPWSLIVGMRKVLAHNYGTVVLDTVFDVVAEHLPSLIANLESVIATLEQETGWADEER